MVIHKLSWSKVQSLTKNGMFGDGGNLWVSVTNNGAGKSWIFRWKERGTGRERVMGLGSVHTYDLKEAREKARECRKLLDDGKDPLEEREGARLDRDIARGLAKTVNDVLVEYSDRKMIARKKENLRKQFDYCFRNPVRDKIGDMPIQKVDTNTILKTLGLEKLWIEQLPTGERLQSNLQHMFNLAIHRGYYRGKNPAQWKGHLEFILPAPKDIHTVTHRASLPYTDIGRFMATLRAWEDKSFRRQGHTAMALLVEFIVLTGVRMSEARLATWEQFDLQTMIWNVPPENLKTGHLNGKVRPVPITKPMLDVIKQMQKKDIDQSPNALVFPSPHGGPLDQSSCSQFLRNTLKWKSPKIDVHGFRSTLVDWCRAQKIYPEHLIKRQLDHVIGNKVDQAYGHDQHLEQRRAMMEEWGKWCAPKPTGTDNVAQINEARKRRRAS